ncbi:MAG TPA: hypothetical protein VES39_10100, partial [Rhodospirillales bacterium]|nr:hypothetical protein [Rhodospirillales bacterium]
MTRIATLATSDHLAALLSRSQARAQELQTQVTSGKRSQTYAGIAGDAGRLLDLETRRQMLDRFARNNTLMEARVNVSASAVADVGATIRGFRHDVLTFVSGGGGESTARIDELQQKAFRAMQSLEDFLNTTVDGRAVFAGSRVDQRPVDIGASTLEAFQERWDGSAVVYPLTRAAQVGSSGVLTPAATGDLSFTRSDPLDPLCPFDTITAANDGAFAGLSPGATITISDSETGNDGSYTVVSSDGDKTITIAGTMSFPPATTEITVTNTLQDPGTDPGTGNSLPDTTASITIGTWYRGDTRTQTHRVDEDRAFTLDINGIDPAFEKAIRALGIIAQGVSGEPGGLDENLERIDQALFLLNDVIDGDSDATPPFGTE